MRLKLFTYEPSYYSLLLVPLAIYYYFKAVMKSLTDAWFILLLITIPLLLSLSFGIIIGTALALLFTILINFRSLFSAQQKLYIFLFILFVVLAAGPIVIAFFSDNIFFQRLENVFVGRDTSFEGRTFDAFYLGYEIASMKSIWFGAGPGQIKVLGLELWNTYYRAYFYLRPGGHSQCSGRNARHLWHSRYSYPVGIAGIFFLQNKGRFQLLPHGHFHLCLRIPVYRKLSV